MSKTKRTGKRREEERNHPSVVFFIALLIGIVLVAWAVTRAIQTPVNAPPAATTTRPK